MRTCAITGMAIPARTKPVSRSPVSNSPESAPPATFANSAPSTAPTTIVAPITSHGSVS